MTVEPTPGTGPLDVNWLRHAYVEEKRTLKSLAIATGVQRQYLSRALRDVGVDIRVGRARVSDAERAVATQAKTYARDMRTWGAPVRDITLYNPEEWSVYVLLDPRDVAVRYVGKTTHPDRRLREHLSCKDLGNPGKNTWIRELLDLALEPLLQIVETGLGDTAHVTEAQWIDKCTADGANLLNLGRPTRGSRITLVSVDDVDLPGIESLALMHGATLPSNLLNKIEHDPSTGCWLWMKAATRNGYGAVAYNGAVHAAHRVVYTCLIGPIPSKHVLDHLKDVCGNRTCVYPGHLEPITNRENILRGGSPSATHAVKTHCTHGHEFTPENTRIAKRKPPRTSERQCLSCERVKDRARAETKKTARRMAEA